MIFKKTKKLGKISKPYYTQNNEQLLNDNIGALRKAIESISGNEPYDVHKMISDQSKRIDVLESIIKKIDPSCILEPKLDIGEASSVYHKVLKRMKEINNILITRNK